MLRCSNRCTAVVEELLDDVAWLHYLNPDMGSEMTLVHAQAIAYYFNQEVIDVPLW